MLRVHFTQAAREDLIAIWAHIAEDNPQAANRLADNPQMGPARDDIRPGLRYLVSGFYLLLYVSRMAASGSFARCMGGAISTACSKLCALVPALMM